MSTFRLQIEPRLAVDEFIDVLQRSTLADRRPMDNRSRLDAMLRNADVIATARDEQTRLVGVARAVTDYAYCTYLSDLAVDQNRQRQGIGRQLLKLVHRTAGLQTNLILLAAPAAEDYYPHIGLQKHPSCWLSPGVQ